MTVRDGEGILDFERAQGKVPPLTDSLRIALATGQVRKPLRESLSPLLRLLADGHYELTGPEPLFDERGLVPAGGWPARDAGRVGYYRRAVRSGLRPVAVVIQAGGRELVLDGRHKILAYQQERLAPAVIRIAAVSRGSGR